MTPDSSLQRLLPSKHPATRLHESESEGESEVSTV